MTLPATIDATDAEVKLTAKERAFVEHYARYRNWTQAYTHAYDTQASYAVRHSGAQEVRARPHVMAAIKARLAQATERSGLDIGWLLQRFVDIATADPRELIGLKIGCCRFCYGIDHQYQWREREFAEEYDKAQRKYEREKKRAFGGEPDDVEFPNAAGGFGFVATKPPVAECPECHGEGIERFVPRDTDHLSDQALLLYGGVKAKRDGYEIIIADRGKALENVGRIMGAFNDKLHIDGSVKALVAVQDIAKLDPQQASKAYQDFVKGTMQAGK